MSQTTLTRFFQVSKRPTDHPASKKRKINDSSVTSSVLDDHILSEPKESRTPASAKLTGTNERKRKVHRPDDATATPSGDARPLFTMESAKSAARRKLDMGKEGERTVQKIPFQKLGNLSPAKKSKAPESPQKVIFEKKGLLSPCKKPELTRLPDEFSSPSAELSGVSGRLPETIARTPEKKAELKPDSSRLLEKASRCSASVRKQLLALKEKPVLLAEPKDLEFVVPVSPRKTPQKATVRPSPIKSPAFKRHLELKAGELQLPKHYVFIEEVFKALDQIVMMQFNRRQLIRVNGVSKGVESIVKRKFEWKLLRKIRCVFPEAFEYQWDQKRSPMGTLLQDYELTMKPNLQYKSGVKPSTTMTALHLIDRKKFFRQALLQIVHEEHRKFLKEEGVDVSDDSEFTRWDPDFDLESLPDIAEVDLPEKPNVDRLTTAKDLLRKTSNLSGINEKLRKAIKEQVDKQPTSAPSASSPASTECPPPPGINAAIWRKICAKEALKNEQRLRDVTRTSAEANELEMLKEMPDVCRNLRNQFVTEKKKSLKLSVLLHKISSSMGGRVQPKRVEELLRYLVTKLDFVSFHVFDKTEFVKLDWNVDVNQLEKKIEELRKKVETGKCHALSRPH